MELTWKDIRDIYCILQDIAGGFYFRHLNVDECEEALKRFKEGKETPNDLSDIFV
jgi:hypothetical protein